MRRRDRDGNALFAHRFRPDGDRYVRLRQGAVYVARVAAVAERVVDLLHILSAELADSVDMRIDDRRRGQIWEARELPKGEVRDVITRLKLPLATYGGVELSLITPADQLTVSEDLVLFAISRTDHFWRLLERFGLREQRRVDEPQWFSAGPLRAVRELADAIDGAAQQLEMQQVTVGGERASPDRRPLSR
jgi:hypothetical protein